MRDLGDGRLDSLLDSTQSTSTPASTELRKAGPATWWYVCGTRRECCIGPSSSSYLELSCAVRFEIHYRMVGAVQSYCVVGASAWLVGKVGDLLLSRNECAPDVHAARPRPPSMRVDAILSPRRSRSRVRGIKGSVRLGIWPTRRDLVDHVMS
jgi:hypothetical protein